MNKWIILAGLFCLGIWSFVTQMSLGLSGSWCAFIDKITFHKIQKEVFKLTNGFYYDVANNDMPTVIFLFLFFLVFIVVVSLIFYIEKKQPQKYSLGIIIFFAILFRLVLLPAELIHENDIYRYLWDGKSLAHGINPYKFAPADLFMYENDITQNYYDDHHKVIFKAKTFSSEDRNQIEKLIFLRNKNSLFFERIGHPQVSTIYPPIAQIIFAVCAVLKEDSIILMKLIFTIFDIGVIFLVVGLLKHFKKNLNMCLIYAWSPLVLKEFPNSGHYDSVVIFFIVLSLYVYFKGKKVFCIFALTAAALLKFFAVVLWPLLRKILNKKYGLIFFITTVSLYLPFFLMNRISATNVFEGLITYNKQWSYNSSIYTIVYTVLVNVFSIGEESLLPAKIVVGLIYIGILFYLYRRNNNNELSIMHKCFLALAILFIVNPVGDPWYFCWSIPFLCFFPYKSWIMLSGLLALSYLNFHSDIEFIRIQVLGIPLLNWIIYGLFFILLAVERLSKNSKDWFKEII